MKRLFTGLVVGFLVGGTGGFLLGVYTLPILVEWRHDVQERAEPPEVAERDPRGEFDRNSPGSDAAHWGEGEVRVSQGQLVFEENVRLAPGPDYRVYLSKTFVQTREEFLEIKPESVEIAALELFSGAAHLPDPGGARHRRVRQRRRVVRGLRDVHRERAPGMTSRGA